MLDNVVGNGLINIKSGTRFQVDKSISVSEILTRLESLESRIHDHIPRTTTYTDALLLAESLVAPSPKNSIVQIFNEVQPDGGSIARYMTSNGTKYDFVFNPPSPYVNAGFVTVDGYTGFGIKARTKDNLIKGNIVGWSQSVNGQVGKVPVGGQMPIGIAASDALVGEEVWVILAGYAWVKFKSGVAGIKGYIGFQSSGGGGVAGEADCSSTVPTTDHWAEIGHVVMDGIVGGLALCTLHFN